MESSEEEDDLPSIESITPQSKIDSVHQSLTEKGIRKLCCELLDLKDAVENMCGDMRTKYLAFLRISEEAVEMEHELVELRKHISSQGILVQDLMSGLAREMDEWKRSSGGDADSFEDNDPLFLNETTDPNSEFLEKIDILLAEHKVDEALEAIDTEERSNPELKGSSGDTSSYKSAFTERKAVLEDQLLRIAKQPSVSVTELKHASNGLIRLGKGPSAHQLLLKHYATSLRRRIEAFLPSCSSCPNTFPATLSKLVFSNISLAAKESAAVFGDDDNPAYSNKVVQWAEREVEYLVRLVKENAAPSETVYALRAASVCLQDCLNYCKALEPQGLILSKLFLVLFRPYVEEVLELNFRRARKVIFDLNETDEGLVESSSSGFVAVLSEFAIASDTTMTDCSIRFMQIVQDILEQLTHVAVLHFGESVLARVLQLYDKYIDFLIKALPGHADEDGLPELQDHTILTRAETDSEQLALLGAAFTILDELLPKSLVKVWNLEIENGGGDGGDSSSSSPSLISSSAPELKEWKRHMAQSFDKLRNYFCLQFVLSFIYSREGLTRLDALIYLTETPDNLHLPSLPFQALFSKLQQLAIIAGDVLLGKEKLQKILLARLTETVIIWLSNEQEFWSAFEDESTPLKPSGLQQLILDMNFTVEIARFAGYPFKVVQNHASVVINRAINIFSSRGINPQSSLPKAEWFTEAAKSAINRLLMGSDEASEAEEEEEYECEEEGEGEGDGHIVLPEIDDDDDEHSESLETSSLSTMDSFESFASASMADLESPSFTDSES